MVKLNSCCLLLRGNGNPQLHENRFAFVQHEVGYRFGGPDGPIKLCGCIAQGLCITSSDVQVPSGYELVSEGPKGSKLYTVNAKNSVCLCFEFGGQVLVRSRV